ncbi:MULTISPECIES: cell division protein FtsK [Bacillaceae]|uniref:cell division protein FtsK n=1 Tax=Bacillaceae TaxID=186817 RepID=UPI001F274F7E|nr:MULTISPECIES: cell division protein FtsK [Bacillaceae]
MSNRAKWKNGLDDLSIEEKEELNKIKKQNPYGLIVMLMGLTSFLFGPRFVIIPIVTILFGLLTIRTFDKVREDNPWTFYVGLGLAIYGLYLFITGYEHDVKI